ncbi:acyl-CoA N-acyltransferase [Neolentinus lepideus HHB14362 ss-1]|uniref:histone acetyltransferase n=1 Tax=Neolentinus lepideus HHB14362 ss-1 TaxID=1314782 RepID=A0A165Q909_9AGAM|nr:acyl-CoA N-acyltransferase [Neolentinus lepideus HHB14362 ss-1]
MPKMNPVIRPPNSQSIYYVTKNGQDQLAHILQRGSGEVYVHYLNTDKRMDEWVPEAIVRLVEEQGQAQSPLIHKRKRASTNGEGSEARSREDSVGPSVSGDQPDASMDADAAMTEEEYDIQHHKQITAKRNFGNVIFGHWKIKTWYFSPYPLAESEAEEGALVASQDQRIPGVRRTTVRSHGRTSDILAGGLGRTHTSGERSSLWVCDRCFKYMTDGASWELHTKKCNRKSPPGRKVYQRGAHIIWEVDGAKDKLYCQNLSLFGKLFIDIKTLYFDMENFMFYVLTDADSQRDHVLGFFSKEKVSYDDYNLACIVVLPPYQRKSYGMLLIEFSYELSRRTGKVGTPERPLSDLGLRSYLTYWISVLIRFFRRVLSVLPPEVPVVHSNGMPDLSRLRSSSTESSDDLVRIRRKKAKGWDGEVGSSDPGLAVAPTMAESDAIFKSLRTVETRLNLDGSATSHATVKCTLADIAQATNMRVEDAAFALNECGLLLRRREDGEQVMISREMVEVVARERGVKRMMMDLNHVLL